MYRLFPAKEGAALSEQIQLPLGDDYIDIRALGEGGMGTLFRAYRRGLGVEVVIKRVKSQFLGKLDQHAEANILKLLKHRYLPRIYDIIYGADGYFYTVMDYIPGENMKEYVRHHGPAGQKDAHRWACQLCAVVAYLHEQATPIIHCDIKPSNVMITPSGDICLIDFNTSLIFHDGLLALGATPGYAAPEQYTRPSQAEVPDAEADATVTAPTEAAPDGVRCTELTAVATAPSPAAATEDSRRSSRAAQTFRAGGYGTVSERTDVYGIGATLYFLVSGRTPEKSLDPVTPLSQLSVGISDTFRMIIERAMQKQPEDRFPGAARMLQALQDVDELDARYKRYRRLRTASRWVLGILFCLSLLCTVYGTLLLYRERQNSYLTLVSQGQSLFEAGDLPQARQVLEEAIRMSPRQADAYLELAVGLYRSGAYQEGYDLVNNALYAGTLVPEELDPGQAGDLYYVQANCLYELGDYAGAVQLYTRALERRQDNDAYYRGLALAQARCGDLEAAQATLDELESRSPGSLDCLIVSAELNTLQGKDDEAMTQYRQILQSTDDPQTLSRIYLTAGQLCLDRNDPDSCIELLEQARSRLGEEASLHEEMLADAYSRKAEADPNNRDGYYRLALDCLQDVLDRGQGNILTRLNLAVVQENLEDFDGAEQTLLAACEQSPSDYRPYLRLAFLEADRQGTLPVEQRSYTQTADYAELAREYYDQAQANGTSDLEMTRLDALLEQLHTGGWL